MANNTSSNEEWLKSHQTIHNAVLAAAILISVPVTLFNLFSIFILVFSRRLRKARNFPIVGFLAASAMQSLFVLPIYIQKTLDEDPTSTHEWICDLYRFPYFFTQHFIKVGLLVASVDRIIAIRCPYRYSTMVSKLMMTLTLLALFVFTLFVDLIPFFVNFGKKNKENCAYLPTQEWRLSVIIIFDMLPFFVIVANYIAIWRIAASISRNMLTQKRVTGVVAAADLGIRKYSLRNHHATSFSENTENNSNARELDDVVTSTITANDAILKQMSFARRRQSSEMSEDQLNNDTNSDTNIIPYNNDVNRSTSSINSNSNNNNNNHKTNQHRSRNNGISFKFAWEMKATRTSIIGGVVYAVCWMPMGFFYIVDHMCDGCLSGERTDTMRVVKVVIKYICLTSSIFLPLIFCWRTKEFRHEVVRMFCKKWHQKKALKSVGLTTSAALSAHNSAAIISNRNAML